MVEPSQDKLYATTLQTIGAVAKLPVVRVDREAFLLSASGASINRTDCIAGPS